MVVAFSGRYHSPYVELFLLAVVHAAAFQPSDARDLADPRRPAGVPDPVRRDRRALGRTTRPTAVIPALTIGLGGGLIYAAAEQLRRQRDAWADREALARRLADQDPLTGLGNYRLFWRTVEREVARLRAPRRTLLGRAARPRPLQGGQRRPRPPRRRRDAPARGAGLAGAVRREDVTCRHGGDEFAVVAVQAGAEEADQLAGRLVDAVTKAGVVDRHRVTATAGWATFGVHAESVEDLVLQADEALRKAKRGGRRCGAGARRGLAPAQRGPRSAAILRSLRRRGVRWTSRCSETWRARSRPRATSAPPSRRPWPISSAPWTPRSSRPRGCIAETPVFETVAFAGPQALAPPTTQPADAGILGAVVADEQLRWSWATCAGTRAISAYRSCPTCAASWPSRSSIAASCGGC